MTLYISQKNSYHKPKFASQGLLQSEHLRHPRENGDLKNPYKSIDSRLRGNDGQCENSACNSPSHYVPASDLFDPILQGKIYRGWQKQGMEESLEQYIKNHPPRGDKIKELEKRLDQAEPEINRQLKESGHKITAEIFKHKNAIFDCIKILGETAEILAATSPTAFPEFMEIELLREKLKYTIPRVRALLDIMLDKYNSHSCTALGWDGYKRDDVTIPLEKSGKLGFVEQDKWLWSHSQMKNPTPELMENVYQKAIYATMNHFGMYK